MQRKSLLSDLKNCDNGAHLLGYTKQLLAYHSFGCHTIHLSIRPSADLSEPFRAFNHDRQEYIHFDPYDWTLTTL